MAAFPNLAFAQSRAERTMTDHVVVTRDPTGIGNDSFDYQTLTETPGPVTTIYSGRCHFSRRGRDLLPHEFVEGDQELNRIDYILSIPLGSPRLLQADTVVIDVSARSPNLIGKSMRLRAPRYQTHEVEDQYDVELRDDVG